MQADDMTIEDVMTYARVSRSTVERWRLKGRGPKRLRWRWEGRILIRRTDLMAFFRAIGRVMGTEPAGVTVEEA